MIPIHDAAIIDENNKIKIIPNKQIGLLLYIRRFIINIRDIDGFVDIR